MTLYFDLDTGVFCSGPGTRDTVSALSFKRGDTVSIALRFVRGIVVQELAAGATGKLGLKEEGDFDGNFVASATSWTKTGTGTSTVYTFSLNLSTTALNTLLGVGAGDDVASVNLNFELEFVADGIRTSSNTVTATIHNDVVKGDEETPTPLPDIIGSTAPYNLALYTSFAGADNDIVAGGDMVTSLVINANPAAFSTPDAVSYSSGVVTVTIGSPGGNVVGTMTANELLDLLADVPVPVDSVFTSTLAPGNSGTGNVVPGTYAFSPTPSPPYLRVADGFLYIQEAGVWKKVALSAL